MAIIGDFYIIPPDDWLFATHGDVIEAKRRAALALHNDGNYEQASRQIEEFVRQWALRQLLDAYGYPKSWLGERLIIEEPVKMGSSYKAADISLKNADRRTFIYVEVRNRSSSDDDFNEAERQLESYLASTYTATIGLVTDGYRVRTIRKKIDPNDFDYISDLPSYGADVSAKYQLVREIPDVSSQRATGLRKISSDYDRILFDCHSTARDVDGLHADEALDEICKVLYAKIYDERQITKQPAGTAFKFQVFGASNSSEVASNIRTLYESAKTADIEIYSKRIPGYERSRGVFKQQIRLSDTALYRIIERLQNFSLIDSPDDIKGRAFQKILGTAIRAGMGQYFTPDPIVELAVEVMGPNADELILDPFCGSGHFLTKALQYVLREQGPTLSAHSLHEFKFFHLHGIEKSDRMVRIAMTDMMLNDDGHTNIRNQDALLSFENYPDITALRDKTDSEDGELNSQGQDVSEHLKDGTKPTELDPAVFDLVLTNPPFGSIMRQEVMAMIGRFDLGHGKKSLPLEIIGLERSLQFLRPGGRLAIVLPEHLMKGKNARFVREWLRNVAHIKAIFFFPEEAFTPYGAMIKTCLCILQKLKPAEKPSVDDATFLCEVENLGYEPTGKLRSGSEVQQAITAFRSNVRWN